ncbi:hypothetical protein FACS1894184_20940 [Clostridia bacterium]|nr:hypothetical protein FACS1894184_20940 [Clostridia bacterium]
MISINSRNWVRFCVIIMIVLTVVAFSTAASAAIKLGAPTTLTPGQSWVLRGKRDNVDHWTVKFNYTTYTVDGSKLTLALAMPQLPTAASTIDLMVDSVIDDTVAEPEQLTRHYSPQPSREDPVNAITTKRIPLEVEATMRTGKTETVTREIAYGTAREALIAEWIAHIQMDDGAERKSGTISSPGQCKHYLASTFAAVSARYELEEAPGITLYMPERPNDEKSGRVQGAAWVLPLMGTGNPFVEAAAYDFDEGKTARENKQAARALLESVRPGDVVQLMAIYNNGARGTHTMMITAPYDPMKDTLYWCDSNLKNKVVDGVRYGIVMAYQTRTVEEVIEWLANPLCAATVYRLADNIGLRAAE